MKRQPIRQMVRDNLLNMAEEHRRNPNANQREWVRQVEALARVAEPLEEGELN